MRGIKFRAKRVDNGEWAYGGVIVRDDYCIIDQGHEVFVDEEYEHNGDTHYFSVAGVMCNEKNIGQYTGLKDKNGNEIYEGDVVKFHFMSSSPYTSELFPTEKFYGVITTNKYNQWIIHSDGLEIHIENAVKYGEIVGNIHDNPELMKEGRL